MAIIKAVTPFNVEIDGILYTDEQSKDYQDDKRLPAETLANIVSNIYAQSDHYDVYMDNYGSGIVILYVDDDEMYDDYHIDLRFIGDANDQNN